MCIDVYHPAPDDPDELLRERAVEASGALAAMNDAELADIVEQARRACGTQMGAVSIIYRDWQYLIATAGLPTGPYSRHTSFCSHVVADPAAPMCVRDTLRDDRFAGNPAVRDGPLVRFYCGAPLLDEAGFALGAVRVRSAAAG